MLQDHMNQIPINEVNGTDWYKCLFTALPAARSFFKGAENIDPATIGESERFQKQGKRFLTLMHKFVEQYSKGDLEAFRKEVSLMVTGHRRYKIFTSDLYQKLCDVYLASYLPSKVKLSESEKNEWTKFANILVEEAKNVLEPPELSQDIGKILKSQMDKIPVNEENGTGWYKCLFTEIPSARSFFVGAAEIAPDAVPSSERFQKQGKRFLTSMHEMVLLCAQGNTEQCQANMRELAQGHTRYKITTADIYGKLLDVWMMYAESKAGMTSAERNAWNAFRNAFQSQAEKALAA